MSRYSRYRELKRGLKEVEREEGKKIKVSVKGISASHVESKGVSASASASVHEVEERSSESEDEPLSSDSHSESGDSINDSCCTFADTSITDEVKAWALETGCTHVSLNKLLTRLKKFHPELPVDARTLLKKRYIGGDKVHLGNGIFLYFELMSVLRNVIEGMDILESNMSLYLHIDGIPLSKSGNKEFWPILGRLQHSEPFIVGLFLGDGKPNVTEFLTPLSRDLQIMKENPVMVNDVQFYIRLSGIICDAPARAFVKGTYGHNSFYACDRCHVRGELVEHTMTFTNESDRRRTHEEFVTYRNANENEREEMPESVTRHIKMASPLAECTDMVLDYPFEFMHLICQGVVRRILHFLTLRIPSKLSRHDINKIDQRIEDISSQFPHEITRKPRTLKFIDKYKASEFRLFLMYVGPIVFKNILRKDTYQHFNLLHSAIRILTSNKASLNELEDANGYIDLFVNESRKIYGRKFVTYNVHLLRHLVEDYPVFGNIETVSAFVFESYLGSLKKMLRSHNKPLEQIHNRLKEGVPFIKRRKDERHPKARKYDSGRYHELQLDNFILSSERRNSVFSSSDDKYYSFSHATKSNSQLTAHCREIVSIGDLYAYPRASRLNGIFLVKKLSSTLTELHLSQISQKGAIIETEEGLVCCMFRTCPKRQSK